MTPEKVQTSEPKAKRKGYRLFKRDDSGREIGPDAPGWKDRHYYFRFQFHGQNFTRCLETNDGVLAQGFARAKAKEIKDSIVRGDYKRLEQTKLRATTSVKVSKLLETYKTCPVDAEASTRTQNTNALRQLLRVAYQTNPEELGPELETTVSQINGQVASKWFAAASAKALAATDQAEKNSIKRSANSRFAQAKSLFVPKALESYRQAECYHAAFEEFLKAGETFKFGRLPKLEYAAPADQVIKTTLEAWEKIQDRNLFLAVGHELAFGLRAGEMGQATWSWWTTREGYPVLDGRGEFKNKTSLLQVRALDPWFTTMRIRIDTQGWRGASEDYILTGTATDRTDNAFRAVSDWLRNLGWDTQKTNHELRKYAGSQIAMKYGIYEASCWLRHSSVKVTEDHYMGYVKRFKPADVDRIPAHWATAPQAPVLRIVEAVG